MTTRQLAIMSITPFLDGERFDLEGERVLRLAFEMVCIALRTGDCDDHVKQAIATKLIALAKAGERNPDRLCEEAVKEPRRARSRRLLRSVWRKGKSDDTHRGSGPRTTDLRDVRNRSFRSGQPDCKSCAPHTAVHKYNNHYMSDQL